MNIKSEKLIYFDNATTSLKLHSFIERLLQSYSDTSWIKDKKKYLRSLINKLANWLGVCPSQISFTCSSTYAINEIFENLIKKWHTFPMTVYIAQDEHISNLASLWNLKVKKPNEIDIKFYSLDKKIFRTLQNERGVILITLRDNLGNRLWNKEEIEILFKNNQELIIIGDFTQSIMTDDICEIKNYFDYFYFSAHKFLGPFGLGCIISSQKSSKHLESINNKNYAMQLDWRAIYVWEKEFLEILRFLRKNKIAIFNNLVNYWINNFPSNLGFNYIHYPNSLIFLVKSSIFSIHDFAYLLEEHKFIFRFNDLCSSNSLLKNKSIIRFSLTYLNKTSEIEKLFELMRYFQRIIKVLK